MPLSSQPNAMTAIVERSRNPNFLIPSSANRAPHNLVGILAGLKSFFTNRKKAAMMCLCAQMHVGPERMRRVSRSDSAAGAPRIGRWPIAAQQTGKLGLEFQVVEHGLGDDRVGPLVFFEVLVDIFRDFCAENQVAVRLFGFPVRGEYCKLWYRHSSSTRQTVP